MLNNVSIMGRMVANPELRTTQSGVSTVSFSVAVERDYTPKGEERKVDFLNITAWRQTAEFICKYFAKGDMIVVQGSIQTNHYEDKNGNKRTSTYIVADKVNFGGGKTAKSTAKADDASLPEMDAVLSDNEVFDEDGLPF